MEKSALPQRPALFFWGVLLAVLHAPREGCRELSLVICLFSCPSMHMSKQRMCKEECKKRTLVIPCSEKKRVPESDQVYKYAPARSSLAQHNYHVYQKYQASVSSSFRRTCRNERNTGGFHQCNHQQEDKMKCQAR